MLNRSSVHKSVGGWSVLVAALALSTSAVAAPPNIVLRAADAVNLHGNWAPRADASAADGLSIAGLDNGWSATSTALASPPHYFDFTFTAPANTPYHVWFRLRASGDSKYNDSVYTQFSDAVDGGGAGVFGLGTTSGLVVNLQRCSGCAMSGWGWMDGAYWLSQASTVSFASTGTHTLRVQTREDGVAIDQVVLSPSDYLSAAPGAPLSDSTVVPKPAPATVTPVPTAVSTSSPYSGSPAAIPGTLQTVSYDLGGEGVAYHDITPGNSGGAFRSDGVDIEASSAGGYNVGWVAAGEWLNYTVDVAAAGQYGVSFAVASAGQGGTFHLEMNGTNVTGTLTVPNTGGWQTWQTVTATATLASGRQVARLVADSTGASAVGNFSSIRFTTSAPAVTVSSSPFSGTPAPIPGTIAASDFDSGAAGTAYSDTTPGNAGGAYRSTDVDIEPSSEGGYDVGWTAAGEWLKYTVSVASPGSYNLQLRVAAPGGGAMHVAFGAPSSASAPVTIPATGGWQNWVTVSVPVALAAGPQTMVVAFDTNGLNLRTITLVPASGSTPTGSTITVPAGGDLQRAIDAAVAGDTIQLTAGATFAGSYVLPAKSGSSFITIRSAAADAYLPADGVRISPANAGQLARIQGGVAGMPAFVTAPGAHHFRLQFLEIVSTYANNDIIQFGDGSAAQSTLSNVAHDLIVDRCYIHGDPSGGQKRGVALNSASTSVINSYISDIKSAESEAQAVGGWNGPGPYTITNNYLEASGENVMFGGSDPYIPNLVPSDIVIRRNYISKPTGWRTLGYTVKNLIELKNAQRVTIDGNVIENCWAAGQQGFAIMLTPRNQNGTAPWSVVQQVTITNNIIRHVASGIDVLGADDINPSQTTNGILISNNLLLDVGGVWGGQGRTLLTLGGRNITFAHNTVFSDGPSVVYADLAPVSGFVFSNNIVPDNAWALMGSGAAAGNGTIAAYYPGAVVSRNVFIGGTAGTYPADNYFPGTVATVQFRNISAGDYGLAAGSPYVTSATDGTAVGVNQAVIDALIPR